MVREIGSNAIRMLIMGLTGKCNFSCIYCYANEHPQECMDFIVAQKALALASASGQPFVLQFSGGEPLLAFDSLKKIVLYVEEKRLPAILQIQTNASLMDRDKAIFLRDHHVGVGVSLDGRPSQNDSMRQLPEGGGTSRMVMAGISALAAAGVEVGVTCVVAQSNVRELAGIVETAYYLGNVRKIGFDLLRAQGRGKAVKPAEKIEVSTALQQVLSTADRLAQQTGKTLIFPHRERVESLYGRCTGAFAHCHAMNGEAVFVNASGELFACASLAGFPEFRLGHVDTGIEAARMDRIAEIIRDSMSFCMTCEHFFLCGGGCFARWLGGGAKGPYLPECALKQTFIQDFFKRKPASPENKVNEG